MRTLLRVGLLAAAAFAVGTARAETETAYRFYRFKIDANSGDTYCQLSELRLYSWNDDVTRSSVNLTHDPSIHIIKNQEPAVLVDDNTGTTWCWEFDANVAWVALEYAEPILITKYEWYVGGDTKAYSKRNPKSWRLQGSNDGTNWADLDVQANQSPPTENYALAYTWNLLLRDGTTLRAYDKLSAEDLFAGCTEVLKAGSGELDASAVTSYPALTLDAGTFSVQNGAVASYTVTGAMTLKGGAHLRIDATQTGGTVSLLVHSCWPTRPRRIIRL